MLAQNGQRSHQLIFIIALMATGVNAVATDRILNNLQQSTEVIQNEVRVDIFLRYKPSVLNYDLNSMSKISCIFNGPLT